MHHRTDFSCCPKRHHHQQHDNMELSISDKVRGGAVLVATMGGAQWQLLKH
jgi:hypothetical protein